MYNEGTNQFTKQGTVKPTKNGDRWRGSYTMNTKEIEKILGTEYFQINVFDSKPGQTDKKGFQLCKFCCIASDVKYFKPYVPSEQYQQSSSGVNNTTKTGSVVY